MNTCNSHAKMMTEQFEFEEDKYRSLKLLDVVCCYGCTMFEYACALCV